MGLTRISPGPILKWVLNNLVLLELRERMKKTSQIDLSLFLSLHLGLVFVSGCIPEKNISLGTYISLICVTGVSRNDASCLLMGIIFPKLIKCKFGCIKFLVPEHCPPTSSFLLSPWVADFYWWSCASTDLELFLDFNSIITLDLNSLIAPAPTGQSCLENVILTLKLTI